MKTTSAPWQPTSLTSRLHLAVTALLGLAVLAGLALLATGKLRVGASQENLSVPGSGKTDGAAGTGTETGKAREEPGGRFRIEPTEATGKILAEATRAGFLSLPCDEVHVFKYQGGYLECRVEAGKGEQKTRLVTVPGNWPQLLRNEPLSSGGQANLPRKEGYLIVTLLSHPPAEKAVRYAPYLGGFLASGPGGPASLLPWPWLSSPIHQEIGLLLAASSPEGEAGPGFRIHTTRRFDTIPYPLVPAAPDMHTRRIGQSRDLTPGVTIPLVDWEWGTTEMSLVANFLTEAELKKQAEGGKGEPGKEK